MTTFLYASFRAKINDTLSSTLSKSWPLSESREDGVEEMLSSERSLGISTSPDSLRWNYQK